MDWRRESKKRDWLILGLINLEIIYYILLVKSSQLHGLQALEFGNIRKQK